MRDVLRSEFPELGGFATHLRMPAVAREPLGWAVLSGIGAGFIASGIVHVALLPLYSALFPPTQPHPEWLTPRAIADVAGGIATSAVLIRAGGPTALAAYIVYDLLLLLTALPTRLLFCERIGGPHPDVVGVRACDYEVILIEHWPAWAALAIGVLAARVLASRDRGANWMLRGAGAFGVILTVASMGIALLFAWQGGPDQELWIGLFVLTEVVGGALAGVLLAPARPAAAVLVAVLIVGPSLPLSLTQALQAGWPGVEVAVLWWLALAVPLVGAAVLLATRTYVHRRMKGTFF